MMDGDDSASEDEWKCIRRRFSFEGLEWDVQNPQLRVLHLWRLLVDAEANLKAARHVNDKLRRQHDEEKVELEEYTEHLRVKCEERVKEMDDEVKILKDDLEALLAGTQAVASMLLKEGLVDVAQSSLGEQIAYLLVERSKLTEELNAARTMPSSDREKELTKQLIKVSTDLEILKQTHDASKSQLTEMKDRVSLLEKASRQLEIDNENLAYKLSEALAEIEENEGQLQRYMKNTNLRRESVSQHVREEYGPPSLRSLPFTECSLTFEDCQGRRRSLHRRESLRSSGRKKSCDSELGNTKRVPPLFPQKVHPQKDDHVHTPEDHIAANENIKLLQCEIERMKKELVGAGDKYEFIVRKYEMYKIKSKNRICSIRSNYQLDLEDSKRLVIQLKGQLSLLEDKLRAEEILRKQLEEDLSLLRTERQKMSIRLRESQRESQDQEKEVRLLQEKINLIEDANSQLNVKLQELKIAATVG